MNEVSDSLDPVRLQTL